MKIFKKNIALIMLFVMIGNFFIAPICNVYAESSSEVETYITTIDKNINSINDAISIAKLGKDYLSDSAYIYAVDKLESEVSSIVESYNTEKTKLGTTISLEKLLTDSNSSYLEDYNNYFTSDMIVTLSNIEDIEYIAGELNNVIPGEELALLIKDTYLKDYYNKINDLSINYGTYLENYKNLYNENNSIDEPVDNNQEITKEVIKDVNKETNKKIRSMPRLLLGGSGTELSNLISEIESLTDEYKTFETEIINLYTNNGMEYYNSDYTLVSSLDNSEIDKFVKAYEKGIGLDVKYHLLFEKISQYSEENPEDTSLSSYIEALNSYYSFLNKDNMMSHYSNIVDNANVTIEDIVDTLLGFTSLDNQSEEYDYLINAKYSFYPVSLKDESAYKAEVSEDYFVVKGSSNIEKDAFNNNIKYRDNCIFELKGENTIIDSTFTLDLKDKDGNLLRTLNIVIKNDVNGDGLIDDKDIDSLRSKLLTEEFSESEKIASDVNEDDVVNTVDLSHLDAIVNQRNLQGNTTEALFDVVVTEKDNTVVYDVYLKTNGIVRAFEFIINNSDNLKVLSISSATGVLFKNNNTNIKVIGLGEYTNDTLLITVTYEKLNSGTESELIIDNGILTFDNNNSITNEKVSNIIEPLVTEKVAEPVATQTVNVVPEEKEDTSSNLVNNENTTIEPKDKKDDVKRESIITGEDLDEEDILWGNIIKIALIVLLGALIIYFLNKDSEEEKKEFLKEETKKEPKEEKYEEKKENKLKDNHNNNNKDSNNKNHTKKKKHKKNRSR